MPIPLLHNVLAWFLKKRVHQIELFLKYPHEVQEEVLQKLGHQAQHTAFGKQYGFGSIKTHEEFANQVDMIVSQLNQKKKEERDIKREQDRATLQIDNLIKTQLQVPGQVLIFRIVSILSFSSY